MRAQARWYSFHFLVHQLVDALERLRVTLNLMLPRLPGARIKTHAHPAGMFAPAACLACTRQHMCLLLQPVRPEQGSTCTRE